MKMQLILKVDEGQDLDLPNAGRLVGTRSYYGKILVLALADPDQVKEINAGQYDKELDEWIKEPIKAEIVAREDEQIDQSELLPYFVDVQVYDEESDEMITLPVEDLTDKIQTFAGRKWLY